jgi:glycosyltransferase involved in cell wall biosynthesis
MQFSIVITTYNRLPLLRRALASALKQTVPCEVVIADNASMDGTEAYGRSLGGAVVYRRIPSHLNHAGAVNAGVEAASGDWIKLVDDDDYLAPGCIETLRDAIARHPQAVICSCQAAQVDLEGNILRFTPIVGPGKACYIPQTAIHYGMLLEQVPFGTPIQVAVQREALIQCGGWDLSLAHCDETDAWVRVAALGDALFINECLAYRTVWSGSYYQDIDLRQRLKANLLIKARIYERVHPTYRSLLPPFSTIEHYLRLHWGLVALKQRRVGEGLAIALPAWRQLFQARKQRANFSSSAAVPQIALF